MSHTFRQNPGIPARNVEGVMAIITPHSSEIHRLNDTATTIWQKCDGQGATREELLETLLQTYNTNREILRADLDQFLAEAVSKGLLLQENPG